MSRPENGSSRRVERPLVRGLSACGPLWAGEGHGEGEMDRGPGMVPEGCGPSRLQPPPQDGAGDRLIGTTAKRFPNEA